MLSLALLTISLFALSGLVVVIAARRAPVGYQDADGFSIGVQRAETRSAGLMRKTVGRGNVSRQSELLSSPRPREMTLVM